MQIQEHPTNQDPKTVAGFGDEWSRFDQTHMSAEERARLFNVYFALFPWAALPDDAEGFDLGCGSGRWAAEVAPRVGRLHCIDASSEALAVAKRTLVRHRNCLFRCESVDGIGLAEGSMDFGYSLGVLHHVPDTQAGLAACVRLLKPNAPFLVYLYYALDNRPLWYRAIWRASDGLRKVVSKLPFSARYAVSQALAAGVYLPLARLSAAVEKAGVNPSGLPLSAYRTMSFKSMRTDALDRFGTRLEQRFTRSEVAQMMSKAGLREVVVSDQAPYWCAVGVKA